jgi:hypothetical protein
LIHESPDHIPPIPPASDSPLTGNAIPLASLRMDMGDVVKMVIPGYKPKSYFVTALRDAEFDITIKVYPNGRASGFLTVGDSI